MYSLKYLVTATTSMSSVWLVLTVAMLIIEGLAPGLVCIWFALGAFAALIAAILHAPLWLQCAWFAVVSVASLILTRPLVKKYVNGKAQPTNADMLIGEKCIVKEDIDNIRGTGTVSAGGKEWSARTEGAAVIPAGALVQIVRIEGVKLIVKGE